MKKSIRTGLVYLMVVGLSIWGVMAYNERTALRPTLGDAEGEVDPFQQDVSGLSPHEAAVFWSDWGDFYAHNGAADKMFVCLTKAVQTSGRDARFLDTLGDSIFTYRKDARDFYGLNEQQVFDLALSLYQAALAREPRNFERAKEIARCYYVVMPRRMDDALAAWETALSLAKTEFDRQDVYVNMARLCAAENRAAEAKQFLMRVTDPSLQEFKDAILHRLSNPPVYPAAPEPSPSET